jgi:hypothetical protein
MAEVTYFVALVARRAQIDNGKFQNSTARRRKRVTQIQSDSGGVPSLHDARRAGQEAATL